jgi:hypothetical protein
MVQHDSRLIECVVIGPGKYDYEIIVERVGTGERFTVHKDAVRA